MPRAAGSTLGPYEIVAFIGAGGMGEVYRARDSKLLRDVAIKILPEAVAADAERLVRFDREAKALAALNHPNIAQVYDSGATEGTSYLVMELVDGDDLSAKIALGRLRVEEALRVAQQIASALAAAHDAGIVHRDLKPANIKVRPDGTVKILDFGLAKATQGSQATEPQKLADSPTVTSPAETKHGVILGTAAYMSPEQARGSVVDRRSDIWAFGAVLYEMLTGQRAFDGTNVTDVLSAVVRAEPDWTRLPADVPPAIRALLQGCLQKERAQRVADISTAQFVIGAASSLSGVSAATRPSRTQPILVAVSVVLTLVSGALLWTRTRPAPATATRHTVTPRDDQPLAPVGSVAVALSPDGESMIYVGAAPGGGTRLMRRNLDDLEAVAVPGSDGATSPAISPDGRSVAFLANGEVRTLPIAGGTPFTVATPGGAPAWSDNGSIYYDRGNLVYRVSAQGGEPVAFTTALPNILQQTIDALPDGRGLLLTTFSGTSAQARISVVGPDGGAPRPLLAGTMARFASGHIVYATANGKLLAAPFDVQRLEISGPAVPIAEGVAFTSTNPTTQFAVSRSGAVLYTTGTGLASELVWVNREGVATSVDADWTGDFGSPQLSPDGTQVVLALQGQESKDIWVMHLDRGSKLRLTVDGVRSDFPTWTPDGRSVTFSSDRVSPSFDLWTKRSDGSGEPALELDEEWALAESLWTPDASWFVHRTSINVKGAGDILAHRKDRNDKPVPIAATRFTEQAPALSPNGHWLAYASSESGRFEVVVVPFPNAGDARFTISAGGGVEPLWSRDGTELFYRNAKRQLVSVRVGTSGTFTAGATSVLFDDRDYQRLGFHRQYDVSPDGRKFLMIRPVGAGRERRVILVRNAFSGLASALAN